VTEASPFHAYGVFKPVGHVVVAFPSEAASRDAGAALSSAGFVAEDITAYTPAQMLSGDERSATKEFP
jgi:hypothetical protein